MSEGCGGLDLGDILALIILVIYPNLKTFLDYLKKRSGQGESEAEPPHIEGEPLEDLFGPILVEEPAEQEEGCLRMHRGAQQVSMEVA